MLQMLKGCLRVQIESELVSINNGKLLRRQKL